MPGMKRIKLLAIVPYEGLREIINESAKAFADLEVDTYIGDMYEGLHIAQELQHNGYVAIISRAGTAELIETVANIPVPSNSLKIILENLRLSDSKRLAIAPNPSQI